MQQFGNIEELGASRLSAAILVPIFLLPLALFLCSCGLVISVVNEGTAPIKRQTVTKETAISALDDYVNASRKVVALYEEDECHAACVYHYFKTHYFKKGLRSIRRDSKCAETLREYRAAVRKLQGSPTLWDTLPWSGVLTEYIDKACEDSDCWKAKREELEVHLVEKLEQLASDFPNNLLVDWVVGWYDFYVSGPRSDFFKEWYLSAGLNEFPTTFKNDAWQLVFLSEFSVDGDDAASVEKRWETMSKGIPCEDIFEFKEKRGSYYELRGHCPLKIEGRSGLGREISSHCFPENLVYYEDNQGTAFPMQPWSWASVLLSSPNHLYVKVRGSWQGRQETYYDILLRLPPTDERRNVVREVQGFLVLRPFRRDPFLCGKLETNAVSVTTVSEGANLDAKLVFDVTDCAGLGQGVRRITLWTHSLPLSYISLGRFLEEKTVLVVPALEEWETDMNNGR